jgi:alpha-glucosidase
VANDTGTPWWRHGVLYQVYPRSFQDTDGDGVGDLRGVIDRLDHLEWLGIEGLWLNPTFPSPNADWGYDVADFKGVHPDLGTLEDLDELIARAGERGIRVLLDLVPNHTSDEHPWFVDSRSSRDAAHRPWYVWRDGRSDGEPPNNWRSSFGGPAWTWDEATGQWYLHNFAPKQPDLDWWEPAVRDAFDELMTWWYDRGIAGFRIDVAHGIVKDRELRDNPAATEEDAETWRRVGQRPEFSMNRDEVHEVIGHWRQLAESRPDRPILVGETWVLDLDRLARFYGTGADELHLAFNFVFLLATFDAGTLAPVVARTDELLQGAAWPVWTMSNHDITRAATRWARDDEDAARAALVMVLTLRGTPVLYYGDELGMRETDVPDDRVRDPSVKQGARPTRDGARTPMVWTGEEGAGFTSQGVEPWLPFGDLGRNVAGQREDPASMLHLCRALIALRRAEPDLVEGAYVPLAAPEGVWAFRRGEGHVVVLNLTAGSLAMDGVEGEIVLSARRDREGEAVDGRLELEPWDAVVARTADL